MKLTRNRKLILTIMVMVIALFVGVVLLIENKGSSGAPPGMREVNSYHANGICEAIKDPECGYCPNKPVDGKCYVKKGELEPYP